MKQFSFILLFFVIFASVTAQQTIQTSPTTQISIPVKDTVEKWKTGGFGSLNFNQVELSNWAKGGESTISATALLNLFANYADKDLSWINICDLGYGALKTDGNQKRKNEDKIDILTKFGYKATETFFYTAFVNFKSQFFAGYNYPNDSVIVSKFFSPAYLITSLGMDWKPTSYFSIYLSPLTGRFIFISDREIADAGTYTSEPGKTFKPDLGAYLNTWFKMDLIKNINLESKLAMFNNYTDKNKSNRGNISIDWTNNFIFKVNEFLSANLFIQTIYDHDVKIPIYQTISGVKTQTGTGPRLQVKEVFGLGLYYKF